MMNQRDSAVRLPSWLIAASLVVVVIATLTYFITTNNDNTDEAAPQAEPTQTDESPTSAPAPDDEKTSDDKAEDTEKKADADADADADEKSKQDDREADKDAKREPEPEKKKQPEVTPDATVDVYNNSGITNLAASVSGDVQSAGFAVGGVDNWYGAIPSTTVYYPPGMEDQARLLADSLGVGRIMPAVDPMSGDRLSLILTAAI